ncbi:hypothetical protein Ccrd_012097 [Cynara cardunculus var. scolymus]|uniref:Uncharacterized protein n=1 Tax=Cynara cardunculus var. scolymus TaxID=59895 RepID=A0A103YI62_CYNCS|nr:hypothetical protein Ccrd_012097 [Cynara cardunculus var. scolymus]
MAIPHRAGSLLLDSSLSYLGTSWVLLVHALNHANSNSLTHIPHSKTSKRRILCKRLHHHGLGRNHLHHTCITIFQKLWLLLELLTRPSVNFGQQLSKLNGNVRSVAIEHSFKTTSGGVDNENSTISLRGSSDHVLDKIPMSRSINDSAVVLVSLKLPQGNINGNTTFTLSLKLVQHPGILERTFVHLSSFFLKTLNHTLVNTSKLVDQVPETDATKACIALKKI